MHHFYGPATMPMLQGNYWWIGLVSMAVHLLFWIVLIYIAVKLFEKYVHKAPAAKTKEDSAMSILRERYARGEIDSEEFNQRKGELE